MLNPTILMIILIAVCVCMISLIIFEIILHVVCKRLTSIINEQSRVIYSLDKKVKRLETNIHDTQETITSLSTSVTTIAMNYQKELNTRIFPQPELDKQITETISNLIAIEVALSTKLRNPLRQSTKMIIDTTIKTYPNVDHEYIAKKALSIIQSYSDQ